MTQSDTPPVAILCGGRGTRLQERTGAIPKALVEIGDKPILWHVIRIYAAQGLNRFLLLTGYLGEQIERFTAAVEWPEAVEIDCVDTGLDTPTGGRLGAVADRLDGGTFGVTYADGVADIDLNALISYHRSHGGAGTVTVVRPRSQFGVAHLDRDGKVLAFEEKPRLDHWINGGFFWFEPRFLSYVEPDSVLEDSPLRRLAGDGELHGFRHSGFWDCMDTYKDATILNDLWNSGEAPWRVWEHGPAAVEGEGSQELDGQSAV